MFPQFKKGFLFGAATAAYQIEGGWNEDGKGPSIWDAFTHTKGRVKDGTTGDTACDTYHDFKTDIALMRQLGLDAYRFSVAWPRVMPQGAGAVNEKGLDYYSRLVDALLENGIRPFVTLYHWDMPLALFRQYGGFAGRETAYRFADYTKIVVKALGDRVTDWITLNEPWEHAMLGHFLGEHAPGIKNPWTYFRVAHHELLAHGLAMQAIRGERSGMNAGITLSQHPVYPANPEPTDNEMDSVRFADELINRFFLDGVFKGAYPEALLKRMRLFMPRILPGDMETIRQPIDFLGVNYYTRLFATHKWYMPFFKTWIDRLPSDSSYYHPVLGAGAYPDGFKELLRRYREDYGNPPVYITENGTVLPEGDLARLDDTYRVQYLRLYLKALQEAAAAEGADLRGYFHWSLIDNFEWNQGISWPFGLIKVDYNTQQRTLRDSARWYRDMIAGQDNRK